MIKVYKTINIKYYKGYHEKITRQNDRDCSLNINNHKINEHEYCSLKYKIRPLVTSHETQELVN